MAGVDLGSLYMSLDLKDETQGKIRGISENVKSLEKSIGHLQDKINKSSTELHKLAEGSEAWNKQRSHIQGMVKEVDNLVARLTESRKEASSLQQRLDSIDAGKLVTPQKSFISQLDTKPIEKQIEKLEKYEQILKHIQDLQGKKNDISLNAQTGLGGTHAWDVYQKRIQEVDEQIARAKASLQEIGGGNMNLGSVRTQLESLYGTLERFDNANRSATSSVRDNRSELEKHRAKQKEVEAAFAPLLAAQQREARQEAANKAHIEATNAARQKQVQVLREQAEAMMRSKLSDLQSNRSRIASMYTTGKSVGLSDAELSNIRSHYHEISREIMTMQTLLQNSKGLSYNEMFSFGRNIGPSGSYVREAASSISRAKQETERLKQETEGSARAARELATAFRQAHDASSKTSGVMSDIKNLLLQGGIVYGAQQFANSIIQTGGEIVQQHLALRNIIGDKQKADELFAQTQKLALESPFTFGDLNRDVKQLAAFGVETNNLYDRTKRLADLSSGLGVSFERLGLAYGQVKSRSWLDGKELRQFAYAGLPLLQQLADLYNETGKDGRNNYTTRDIRDMVTKRQVSFEDVDSVIKKLTDEGGQFYNMQYVLSDTLLGRWNKLIDAWDIMLGKFADGKSVIGGFFMSAINGAVALVQSIDKLGPIFLAAFSGIALKKLSTSIGGGFVGSFLSSKQSLAAKYQEKALTGELNAEEQRILSTKRQITAKDLESLASLKALTSVELQRAYLARQITTSQYKQISALIAQKSQTTSLAARLRLIRMETKRIFTAGYWENFAARGKVAFDLLKVGAVSLGSTIWTAIGGLPGLLITGATMLFSSWMESSEELKQTADSIAENAKQTYDDLRKYIEENPINLKASISDIAEQIKKEKDILKEKAGSGYDSIIIDVATKSKGDPSKQLDYLRKYTDLYARAAEKAQAMKNVMTDAEEASKGLFRESIQTNLEDLEKSAQKLSLTTSKMSMAQLVKEAEDLKSKSGISSDFKKFADIILEANKNGLTLGQTLSNVKETALNMSSINFRGVHGTDLSKFVDDAVRAYSDSRSLDANIEDFARSLSGQFENLAKDPMEQALYHILKDGWKSANNLDVVQGAYFDMKLDQAMGLKEFPSLAEDMAKDAAGRISDTTRQLLASGQPLTKAAQEDVRKATNAAMDHFRATWPGNANEIQRIIGSEKFSFNVYMHVVGDKSMTQEVLDDFYLGKPGFSGNSILLRSNYQGSRTRQFSNKGESYYKRWSEGVSSPNEVEKKAREDVNKALEIYNSAVRQRGKVAAKPYLDSLNSVRAAFKEVIGYSYAGESTDITKKINTRADKARKAVEIAKRKAERAAEKARIAEERHQRKILHIWQSRKKLLEEYYETWNKWRTIEGKEDAKTRLRNDKRFDSINKVYTDPENLAGNLSNLVEGYKELAKTEEQRNFIAETRAEAAKKEADVEYKNASDRVEMLNEQLDLLSKQYDLYQRLSKVTSSTVAADFSFGSNGVYRKDKNSYYGYLRDKLKAIEGQAIAPKNFISNEMPASERGIKSLDEVRVTAGVKKINFGPDGLEGVLQLTDSQIKDKFGQELSKILIDFKKETNKLDEKIADSLVHGFEYLQNYQAEIDSINQSYDEQIERLEKRNQLEKDNAKYISDEALRKGKILLEQQRSRDISNVNLEATKHSALYHNFFGAITTLNTDEVEKYSDTIKDYVNKAFQSGAIDAREYAKEMKQINDQMEKVRNRQSDFITYLQGGLDAVIQKRKELGEEMQNRASNDYEQASKYFQNAKLNGDTSGMQIAQNQMNNAKIMGLQGEAMSKMANGMKSTVSTIDAIVNGINNAVQGMKKFVDQIADDFDKLGKNGDDLRDSDGYQFISGFSEASQGATDGWNSLKNGDVMGTITGVYRSFSGWFTGSAKAQDAKLERQIKIAEQQLNVLSKLQTSIDRNLTNTLGGVYEYSSAKEDTDKIKEGLDNYTLAKNGVKYGQDTRGLSAGIGAGVGTAAGVGSAALIGLAAGSAVGPIGMVVGAAVGAIVGAVTGFFIGHKKRTHSTVYTDKTFDAMEKADRTQAYYDQQYAVLMMKRDLTADKLKKAEDEKKKDEGRINDFKNELRELDDKIKTFAMDMAKSVYDIDLKSWAKELTNAIVDAWSRGEDAAKAYHDKVRDLMKNLAKNIMIQKIMEPHLKKVEEVIIRKMNEKSGKFDDEDILEISNALNSGLDAVDKIADVFKRLQLNGLDLRGNANGSGSIGNNIKNITEETANILSSYVNAIRLDVSVSLVHLRKISDSVSVFPEMNAIASSQLTELKLISLNTQRNADFVERIYSLFKEVTTPGVRKINIH